eukprot:TRINITY_DN40521_c0_g1_i3.p1 TRINITY_DN40521_c0_g1~~TRINITY_DN40521_c0_g1_i3.p1  ORF type:complete len:339 (+),score=17.83 TRINITY_DN40521_c0_g1_i3:161-1177(+)
MTLGTSVCWLALSTLACLFFALAYVGFQDQSSTHMQQLPPVYVAGDLSPRATTVLVTPMPVVPKTVAEVVSCLRGLNAEAPWLAVYGDSLSRGLYFDLLTLLNSSAACACNGTQPHPGHGANFSGGCTLFERRPPIPRLKCGGFAHSVPLESATCDVVAQAGCVTAWSDHEPPSQAAVAYLSFRLKTFMWTSPFDEEWLAQLRASTRLPDVLLLSSGLWDMQYPANDSVEDGIGSFNATMYRFLSELRAAIDDHAWPKKPSVLWLTVTAISQRRLPAWKRPRMNSSLSQLYNKLAMEMMPTFGVEVVDTFSSALLNPRLTKDGIHYPGLLSMHSSPSE